MTVKKKYDIRRDQAATACKAFSDVTVIVGGPGAVTGAITISYSHLTPRGREWGPNTMFQFDKIWTGNEVARVQAGCCLSPTCHIPVQRWLRIIICFCRQLQKLCARSKSCVSLPWRFGPGQVCVGVVLLTCASFGFAVDSDNEEKSAASLTKKRSTSSQSRRSSKQGGRPAAVPSSVEHLWVIKYLKCHTECLRNMSETKIVSNSVQVWAPTCTEFWYYFCFRCLSDMFRRHAWDLNPQPRRCMLAIEPAKTIVACSPKVSF